MENKPGNRIQVHQAALPKGGGAIQGMGETFTANEFSGTSAFSVPIPATPCRGFEPRLSLDYSSGNGQSAFGLGWSLSLPEISRQTSLGIPRYDDSDTFLFAGGDYLVPKLDATGKATVSTKAIGSDNYSVQQYLPRTEGDFDLIERYSNLDDASDVFWRVTGSDNIVSIYGKSESAKIYDPADSTRIFKWSLEESYDAKGNHEVYLYQKENANDIPARPSETNRDKQTNTYLTQINYGNEHPITDGSLVTGESSETAANVHWLFSVVLDYGEYDIDPMNGTPCDIPVGRTWACRADPYSSYDAGFEIRTYRLCRNILIFHYFAEIATTGPTLSMALCLTHSESPLLTLLEKLEQVGYQYHPALDGNRAHYRTRSLPPLAFGYTPFAPAQANYVPHRYACFDNEKGKTLTQTASPPDYQLIDLFGDGIPGVLYADGQTIRYRPASQVLGTSMRYGEESNIPFPAGRRANDAYHTLTDVRGHGKLSLMVSTPGQTGYYEVGEGTTWQPFVPFDSFPTDYHYPLNTHVDVTGDGLADILLVEKDTVRAYPALGQGGYGPPLTESREHGLPMSQEDTPIQIVRFADMIGTGQAQLVRISNRVVECWPSLGYGRFGERVVLDNAPDFGEDFDTTRLLLTDINGTGTSDLVYVSPDHIDIYLNQSGNAFSTTPITIALPATWDRLDQIQFADVRGNGTSCLVFTQTHPEPRQWFYDFNQTAPIPGMPDASQPSSSKPYLLHQIDNNMGARTQITYAASTKFYLADKAQGLPWITSLPFPVNLVESITHIDEVAHTSETSTYSYHHGYYDGFEREFRGFGRVDRTDATSFSRFQVPGGADGAAYCPPPAYTRTWYHTGACSPDAADLLTQYMKEYWSGDAMAYPLPGTDIQYLDDQPCARTVRAAFRALHGTVLRTEVYGNDGSPWQDLPYTVTETQFQIVQQQQMAGNRYPVFLLHQKQHIAYDYERNVQDPRISHGFNLEFDAYGQVLKSCEVHYGRRSSEVPPSLDPQTAAQQRKTWIVYEEGVFINTPELAPAPDFYLLGVEQESSQYEISGLTPDVGKYFSHEGIKGQITKVFSGAAGSASLLHWERSYYYDAASQRELPLGQVTAQALHHRSEFVEFEVDMALPGLPSGAALAELLSGDGTQCHQARGGYITFDAGDAQHYFWNPGSAQRYDATRFYLPSTYFDPFQYPHIKNGAPALPPDVPQTAYSYDRYALLIQQVLDPLGNTSRITAIDYQSLQAVEMRDVNGTVTSIVVDPLGLVIATSLRGHQAGEDLGFADLANYQVQDEPTLDAIIATPEAYLQRAARFFFYNPHSWRQADKQPVHTVTLHCEDYTRVNGEGASSLPFIQIGIAYSDGFGRPLQTKTLLDSPADTMSHGAIVEPVIIQRVECCWLTSGAMCYDGKGQAVKQYEPFFSPYHRYTDDQALNSVGYADTQFHDSLGRPVLQLSTQGFVSKTLFGSWNDAKPPVDQAGYLNGALYSRLPGAFEPSPWSSLNFDANDALLDSSYTPNPATDVDIDAIDKALKFANTPVAHIEDSMGRVVQSMQLGVPDAERNANFASFDVLGNELSSADQRLHALSKYNFQSRYNLGQEVVQVISTDAGTRWTLTDVLGQALYHKDSRSHELFHAYDVLHRPVRVYVQGGDGPAPLAQIVKLFVYGDSQNPAGHPYFKTPEGRNLRGKAVISLDEAGLTLTPSYSINSQALQQARWIKTDYKGEADWSCVDPNVIGPLAQALDGAAHLSQMTIPASLSALLGPAPFIVSTDYDALGRPKSSTDADGNIHTPDYYSTNWLRSLAVTPGACAQNSGASGAAPSLSKIRYNARGQRTFAAYGNSTVIVHDYDPMNFNLIGTRSVRYSSSIGDKLLQKLSYHHDPVGNVTSVTNHAIPTEYFKSQKVEAKADYTFDSLYQLVTATGREQAGLWNNVQANQNKLDKVLLNAWGAQQSNGKALQSYTQTFGYDSGGNLTQVSKTGNTATRVTTVHRGSNRMASSTFGAVSRKCHYDGNGNMLTLDGTAGVSWNYRDNMACATAIVREGGDGDTEYYVYDGAGQRVRKVAEAKAGGVTTLREVLYVGGIEIRRTGTRKPDGTTSYTREWHHLRVTEGDACFCDWRYCVDGTPTKGAQAQQLRYQLNDLLNSSCLELDDQASIISYEEYYPYGGTSVMAAKSQTEVKHKHYRYSGKEADVTGLYYYGMRYYAPWFGRWTSADPAGTVDGLNLYAFVGGNPTTNIDIAGMTTAKKKKGAQAKVHRTETLSDISDHHKGFARMRWTNTKTRSDLCFTNKKKFKMTLIRKKQKGHSINNKSQGVRVGASVVTKRQLWSQELKDHSDFLNDKLFYMTGVTPGFHGRRAEILHMIPHSKGGTEEEVNATAGSFHANTEDIAHEAAMSYLQSRGVEIYHKVTHYIKETEVTKNGHKRLMKTLTRSRHKYYLKFPGESHFTKSIDWAIDGNRGEIGKDEFNDLFHKFLNAGHTHVTNLHYAKRTAMGTKFTLK